MNGEGAWVPKGALRGVRDSFKGLGSKSRKEGVGSIGAQTRELG